MDQQSYEFGEKIAEEINFIHNLHATNLLKKVGIDPEEYKKDPNIAREKGYVFVHESKDKEHRFVIAQVVAEDRYTLDVKFNIDSVDVEEEKTDVEK
jgi:hypothetical protein